MGNSTAATLTEIEQTRNRLERDVAELAERLPAPAIWLKRLAGVAVGGGVGGSLFWFVAHRIRSKAKEGKEEKAERAEKALKNAPAAVVQSPVIQVLPPPCRPESPGQVSEPGSPGAGIVYVRHSSFPVSGSSAATNPRTPNSPPDVPTISLPLAMSGASEM